jgi:hypothetical protein
MDIMKDVRGMREMDMTLEDWRALIQKDGWQAAHVRLEEFRWQVQIVQSRLKAEAEEVRARRAKGQRLGKGAGLEKVVEFYRMEVAVLACIKVCSEEPGLTAERQESLQSQMLAQEQWNANLREMIAMWKWRRGELDA